MKILTTSLVDIGKTGSPTSGWHVGTNQDTALCGAIMCGTDEDGTSLTRTVDVSALTGGSLPQNIRDGMCPTCMKLITERLAPAATGDQA